MIFLDIETKAWNNSEGVDFFKISDLEISYVGVIDETGKEMDFWEDDIEGLGKLLRSTDWVVGYNSISFDLPVIANYLGEDINNVPQIDLMVAIYKKIGFRPKLDDVANATLGYGKSGKGSDAPKLWEEKRLQELRDYCMQDVRVTKNLYDFVVRNGFVKYYDKSGFLRQTEIDWDLGKKVPIESEEAVQGLF